MKVQFILHSSFLVEFEEAMFIFDYYDGELTLPEGKAIYFFVSHKHGDHFNLNIFEFAKKYKNITYILPNDMKRSDKYLERHRVCEEAREHILYVRKSQEVSITNRIQMQTLKSTDEGVAYLITYQDVKRQKPVVIYHAGDLNWWTWKGEEEQFEKKMEADFKVEIDKLIGQEIDLAFLPLDPRQEERFFWGFDYFARKVGAKNLIPMHMWEDYSVIKRLKAIEKATEYKDRIIDITQQGQWLKLREE